MAVQYQIREGVLTMMLEGTYESRDVIRTFLDAIADPACPRPVALLMDVSRSTSLASRPAAEIKMVAEFLGPYAEHIGGRVAVLAPSNVAFGLSRMGAVHSEGVGVAAQVFRDREEAVKWLRNTPVTSE
ncbi:MAG TPA: hypothetical protein VJY35_16785 [Candidatus Eisenbacteria bacterium]|nr:hypothetical protein [Candidatus Eisenbacteria bacterium]